MLLNALSRTGRAGLAQLYFDRRCALLALGNRANNRNQSTGVRTALQNSGRTRGNGSRGKRTTRPQFGIRQTPSTDSSARDPPAPNEARDQEEPAQKEERLQGVRRFTERSKGFCHDGAMRQEPQSCLTLRPTHPKLMLGSHHPGGNCLCVAQSYSDPI